MNTSNIDNRNVLYKYHYILLYATNCLDTKHKTTCIVSKVILKCLN